MKSTVQLGLGLGPLNALSAFDRLSGSMRNATVSLRSLRSAAEVQRLKSLAAAKRALRNSLRRTNAYESAMHEPKHLYAAKRFISGPVVKSYGPEHQRKKIRTRLGNGELLVDGQRVGKATAVELTANVAR